MPKLKKVFEIKREETLPPAQQFMNAIYESGLECPTEIIGDGKCHRFNSYGKRDKAGFYIFHDNPAGISAGVFGCWRTGQQQTFVAKSDRQYTPVQQMEMSKKLEEDKKRAKEEKEKQYEVNAETVSYIWGNATPADSNHEYLSRKKIQSHGAKVTGDGRLIIPLYTEEGSLASLQYISSDGKKQFHSGGKTGGCFHYIGPKDTDMVYIVEGYADACTVVEETGQGCFIAFSGSNMVKIAPIIKELSQNKKIAIISDNDAHGKGQEYAKAASDTINCQLIVPPVEGDINDYRLSGADVKELLEPKQKEPWLVPVSEFCSKPAPIKWLVKNWLEECGLSMVFGKSGGGKTFFVLDLALTLASDLEEWNGYKCKKANVVYLAGEGHTGLKSRIKGWMQKRKQSNLSFWISKTGLDLDKDEGLIKTYNSIKEIKVKPDLIIVDTLHRFLAGDENSAQDVKTMLDSCSSLTHEFGCSVLLVHHTGVSESGRARGSSAWKGALENEINVIPGSKEDGKPMEVIQEKMKNSDALKPHYFDLQGVIIDDWFDEDDEPVGTAILEPTEAPKKKSSQRDEDKTIAYLAQSIEAWEQTEIQAQDPQSGHKMVSRNDIYNFLRSMGRTENSAKQEIKPGAKGRLLNHLIEHGKLVEDGNFYRIIED